MGDWRAECLNLRAMVGPNCYTAHIDTFARDNLPPREQWPDLRFTLPELQYPERVNCAARLLDAAVAEGHGNRVAIYAESGNLTYQELLESSNRIAHVLVAQLGVVAGNRVLLRGGNCPMLSAAWFAVMKVGAIAVTTMPMLRAKELAAIATKGKIDHVIGDDALKSEVLEASRQTEYLKKTLNWGGALEEAMGRQRATFATVDTAADDVALLAFTSGTTGNPKATMHFHRDILAMCDTVARHVLKTSPRDIYLGSPPLGFTFGLGALLAFPAYFRAGSVLLPRASPRALLEAVQRYKATCFFTAPTMYKNMLGLLDEYDLKSLRRCVSAGEFLPKATSDAWFDATGIRLIDGLGSTEMIHIFISAEGAAIRPGSTGRPIPGYEATILGENGEPLPVGSSGLLAVRGPTGCRYLADDRQLDYVKAGWNITGDRYRVDEEGYFWFESRADDMIVSSGYNIAGAEVEAALLTHAAVREAGVVGAPDPARGQIVKAFIVLAEGVRGDDTLVKTLQDYVKSTIAPFKYPRAIEFVDALPKGPTGKILRFVLREAAGRNGSRQNV